MICILQSLQEFSETCGVKEEDNIKAVLPFWPRIYSKMTLVSRLYNVSGLGYTVK